MLLERLIPLADGRHFALTLEFHSDHESPEPADDLAYARVIAADGSATDRLALVVEPIAPDLKKAKELAKAAKMQRDFAAAQKSKATVQRMLAAAERSEEESRQAAAGGSQLPQEAWPLGGDRVLLGYHRNQAPRWYRDVCLATGRELDRFDAKALAKAMPRAGKVPPKEGELGIDDVEAMLAGSAQHALKTKVLVASPHGMLVDGATRRFVLRRDGNRFVAGQDVADMRGHVATASGDGFVVEIAPTLRTRSLVRLGASPATEAPTWPRGKAQASALAAASHWVAIGGHPDELSLLDTRSDRIEPLPPILGKLGKDEAPDVRLSPDARFVAAFVPFGDKPLAVLDRESGRTAQVPNPAIEKREAPRQWRVPAFELVDGGLATLARGALAITPWAQLPWGDTPAPVKKPARKAKA